MQRFILFLDLQDDPELIREYEKYHESIPVEIEKSIELLAPAVASREQVMKNVVDSARARIAARKKQSASRLTNTASGSGEQMEE